MLSRTPSFDLEFDIEDDSEHKHKGHIRIQRPKLDIETCFQINMNPTLNTTMNTTLTSRTSVLLERKANNWAATVRRKVLKCSKETTNIVR